MPIVGGAGRNLVKVLFTLITLFFFYRDAETLLRQTRHVLQRLFGESMNRYIRAATEMTRAVVGGLLVTAFTQGALAGLGYWIAGVRAPVLLGMFTALVAAVPMFGTFLVLGPISVYLLLTGELWPGIGLMAWGAVIVHPVDNVCITSSSLSRGHDEALATVTGTAAADDIGKPVLSLRVVAVARCMALQADFVLGQRIAAGGRWRAAIAM